MAYMLGSLVGAVFVMGLLSRLTMWMLKKPMGDTPMRICVAGGLAYVIGLGLAGWGNANGGPWNPGSSMFWYLVAAIIWIALDFRGLSQRDAKRAYRPEQIF